MDYTSQDLIDILSDILSPKETVQFINDLIGDIDKRHTDVSYNLELSLQEFANHHDICNACGNELSCQIDYENSEYNGKQVSEEIDKPCCKECGCHIDD